jgi:hypothetical protein
MVADLGVPFKFRVKYDPILFSNRESMEPRLRLATALGPTFADFTDLLHDFVEGLFARRSGGGIKEVLTLLASPHVFAAMRRQAFVQRRLVDAASRAQTKEHGHFRYSRARHLSL